LLAGVAGGIDEVTEGATDSEMFSISVVILLGSKKFGSTGFGTGIGGGFTMASYAAVTSLPEILGQN